MKISKNQISKIKELLFSGDETFVAFIKNVSGTCSESSYKLYTSKKKGIAPIMDMLKTDRYFFDGAVVADRVIGKAAAMLLIDSGAQYIFGEITSEHSFKVLDNAKNSNPDFSYEVGTIVPYIINRTGDDMCPMEKTVLSLENPSDAYAPLKEKLKSLQS